MRVAEGYVDDTDAVTVDQMTQKVGGFSDGNWKDSKANMATIAKVDTQEKANALNLTIGPTQ
eukprot:10932221-Ditylum_brightwellii.AAC.1